MQTTPSITLPAAEIAAFCRRWRIVEFALFGSILRPDFDEESDIDVLVTFAPDARYGFRQLTIMQDELEALFGRPVDLLDKQAVQESPNYIRRHAILHAAEVVYAQ
jgi:predicted nucleotidyltransferase